MRLNLKKMLSIVLSVACIAGNANGVLAAPTSSGQSAATAEATGALKEPIKIPDNRSLDLYGEKGEIIIISAGKEESREYLNSVKGVSLAFDEEGLDFKKIKKTSERLSAVKVKNYAYNIGDKKDEKNGTTVTNLGIANLDGSVGENGLFVIKLEAEGYKELELKVLRAYDGNKLKAIVKESKVLERSEELKEPSLHKNRVLRTSVSGGIYIDFKDKEYVKAIKKENGGKVTVEKDGKRKELIWIDSLAAAPWQSNGKYYYSTNNNDALGITDFSNVSGTFAIHIEAKGYKKLTLTLLKTSSGLISSVTVLKREVSDSKPTEERVKVSFLLNDSELKKLELKKGEKLTKEQAPEVENLKEWINQETKETYSFGTAVEKNLTLVAKRAFRVKLSYKGEVKDYTEVSEGDRITKPTNAAYQLVDYWYDSKDDNKTPFDFNKLIDKDLTLVAKEKHKVEFFSWNGKEQIAATQYVKEGEKAEVPSMVKGRVIEGLWYVKNGENVEKYSFETGVTEDLKLYAMREYNVILQYKDEEPDSFKKLSVKEPNAVLKKDEVDTLFPADKIDHWEDIDGKSVDLTEKEIDSDAIFYAVKKKEKVTYEVRFYAWNSNEELSGKQTVTKGEKAKKPVDVKNVIGDNWYLDKQQDSAPYNFNDIVERDITLYAKRTYNGKLKYSDDSQSVDFQTSDTAAKIPEDKYNKFKDVEYWYEDGKENQKIENIADYIVTRDNLTIVAKKKPVEEKKEYTVIFKYTNTKGQKFEDKKQVFEGTVCSEPDWKELKWKDGDGDTLQIDYFKKEDGEKFDFTKEIVENITLIAVPKDKYTVIFKVDDEEEKVKVYKDSKVSIPEKFKSLEIEWKAENETGKFNFDERIITNNITILGTKKNENQGGNPGNNNGQEDKPNPPVQEPQEPEAPQPQEPGVPNHSPEYNAPIFIEPIVESGVNTARTTNTTDNNNSNTDNTVIREDVTPLSAGGRAKIEGILDSYKDIRMKDIDIKGYNKLMREYKKALQQIKSKDFDDKKATEVYKKLKDNKKKYVKADSSIKRIDMSLAKALNKKKLFALVKKLDKYMAGQYSEKVLAKLLKAYDKAIKALNDKNISDKKLDVVYKNLLTEKKNADKFKKKNK